LLGPNHIGKSTLLKVLAGAMRDLHLSRDSSVLYNDKPLPEFGRTNISYVPQGFRETLFPWLSVGDNLRLRLLARSNRDGIEEQVKNLCQQLGFDSEKSLFHYFGFAENGIVKRPLELSGGQQQTLTLLRALLPTPKMILLDEPFSAIDIFKGKRLRDAFLNFVETNRITTLLVTHIPEEATYLCDRILMLRRDDGGANMGKTYDVGQCRPGPNLNDDQAKAFVEKIKSENRMG
jgi:NitT/TauT family transport system ATP-binding protein